VYVEGDDTLWLVDNYFNKTLENLKDNSHAALLRFLSKGNIDLGIIYVGRREDQGFSTFPATRVELPSYTVVNLAASYDLNSHLQMFGRVENLLDKDYEEVLGFGAPGITGYGGIRLSY
jgi:vitamin B12 transporter